MAANAEASLSPARYWLRRNYQRFFTRLPYAVRRFDELFPRHCDYLEGVFSQRPRFTGVLRQEAGKPFAVQPTRYVLGQGKGLGAENDRYLTSEPERIVYALAEGRVYGNHGSLYDPRSRHFIAETCESWDVPFARHDSFARPGFPAPHHLPGTSLLLTTLGGQTFYHFFAETLPKLSLLKDLLPHCDHVLISRYGEDWKRRWLAQFGITGDRIVILDELTHLHCDQVIFTNRVVRHFEASPWSVETLRNIPGLPPVPRQALADGKVFWLDRTRQHMRPVEWEQQLIDAVPQIQPVRLDQLTPNETATLLGSARALIGFHGAAFANIVFCPPGTQVFEIFIQPNYPWYARLAQSCGHDHTAALIPTDREAALAALLPTLRQLVATHPA